MSPAERAVAAQIYRLVASKCHLLVELKNELHFNEDAFGDDLVFLRFLQHMQEVAEENPNLGGADIFWCEMRQKGMRLEPSEKFGMKLAFVPNKFADEQEFKSLLQWFCEVKTQKDALFHVLREVAQISA